MKTFVTSFLATLILFSSSVFAQHYNLSKQKVLYTVGYAHLDTQWRWDYPTTIDKYVWNTMEDNFALFKKYPNYIFNFTGANRYRFMQQYYPAQFDSVKMYIKEGRWFPAGSSIEENDELNPSAESIIRQVLYGNEYFRKEFGVASDEYMLPDCFGFAWSLPSILASCGIKGFSTQKLTWGSAVGIPFNVGRWIGPDGHSVIAALNPGDYAGAIKGDLGKDTVWVDRINKLGRSAGVYTDYMYYGTGDVGGSPTDSSVWWLEKSLKDRANIRVVSSKADQMFKDITPAQKAKLPSYTGDLLLTNHSAGSINSAAYLKRWNRKLEFLGCNAEAASVMGTWLGGMTYPTKKMDEAWWLTLATQFHDMLAGTCIPEAFDYMWNDQLLAANQFSYILADASGATVRALDTRGEGIPVVVYNSLPIERQDVAKATVTFPGVAPKAVRVFAPDGKEVPSQIQKLDGDKLTVVFLAKTPSMSYSVYEVRESDVPCSMNTGLQVTDSTLENSKYVVKIDKNGDVSTIYDRVANKELLSAPIRLAFMHERPEYWPAWNMDWSDQKMPPEGYVDGPAKMKIVEDGPARIGIQVIRDSRNSKVVQEIRLAAGEAGDRVEFKTFIDWATLGVALDATFPLTVSNPMATYNEEVGTVERGNNGPKKFEVPSHQWFDLTDKSGDYGVSILEDCKNGSDKPSDNEVRLTLMYTPGVREKVGYLDQAYQDIGKNNMLYAVYGHEGGWKEGNSDLAGLRLNQPLITFQAPTHSGYLGKSFSFMRISNPDIHVMALKRAENGKGIILRIVEAKGKSWKNVEVSLAGRVLSAKQVDGQERYLGPATVRNGKLIFDATPYHIMTFELNLAPPKEKLSQPESVPVHLPYNMVAMTNRNDMATGNYDQEGRSYPLEVIPKTIVSEDISFAMGPRQRARDNAVACDNQTIRLPKGKFNRLYMLAASGDTLQNGTFMVGDKSVDISVEPWSGFFGQWDKRLWDNPDTLEKNYGWRGIHYVGLQPGYTRKGDVGYFTQFRHLPDGKDEAYAYAYIYKYRIDLPAGAKEVKLPANKNIRIFAMSAAYDENDNAKPAQALFDTLNYKHGYDRFLPAALAQSSPETGSLR